MKLTEHEMLVTLATMAIKMDDLTGHDVIEALKELGYGDVVAEARKKPPKRHALSRVMEATAEPVGAWRKCQLSFTIPQDAVVVGIELDVSEGGAILPGSVLASVRPLLLANETCLIRVANGRFEQHVSLTLILEDA